MAAGDEDDREAIDRAFADLVAGYHLTAERPSSELVEGSGNPRPEVVDGSGNSAAELVEGSGRPSPELVEGSGHEPAAESTWADDHPLFRGPPPAEPVPEPAEERYLPEPPPPLPKPAWPVLLAWLGMGYAILLVLAVVVGVRVPGWAGWLAVLGFVGGFGILVTRLPRTRPPDAGDGAVL
jgi:hypothetical protein